MNIAQITKLKSSFYLFVLCASWFLLGWFGRSYLLQSPIFAQGTPDIAMIEQVRGHILNEGIGDVPESRELTYAAIQGMFNRTGDDHASLLKPPFSQRFGDDFSGNTGVIGLFSESQEGQMVVTVLMPDDPAEQAGLQLGDILLSIDDHPITEYTTVGEVINMIRGAVGEAVHITAQRGEEQLAFAPIRKPRPMVEAKMVAGDIAYLFQHTFTTNTPTLVKEALTELLEEQPKALIWDLRSNGGGSMQATQAILSYFVDEGQLFTVELKDGKQEIFSAVDTGFYVDIPMVVLVADRTYSSAETAAATLHELGRGTIIGTTTYGKGTVQSTYPLPDGALFQMTIGKWLSPSGKWFETTGFTPELEVVDDPDSEQDEAIEYALNYIYDSLLD